MRAVDPRTGRLYRVVDLARRFKPPPKLLQQARLDNLAIVPASLLPYKVEYQALANQQPPGTTLIVLPVPHTRERATFERVVYCLRARGQRIATVSARQIQCARPDA